MARERERVDAMMVMLFVIFSNVVDEQRRRTFTLTSEYVSTWLDVGTFLSRSFYLFIRQTGYLHFFKEL